MGFGNLSDDEIEKRISTVSVQDMKTFNDNRMKKYRIYTLLAFACGISSVGLYFINQIFTIIIAVLGIGIISITGFKRSRWRNLYENFLYLKNKQVDEEEQKKQQKSQRKDKYRNLNN